MSKGAWIGRGIAGLMGLLFVYAGVIQFNDPDPLLWVATYFVAAGLCLAHAFGRPAPRPVVGGVAAVASVWAIWLATIVFGGGEVRQMFPEREKTGIVVVDTEEGREMGGLVFIALTLGGLALAPRSESSRGSGESA